MRTAEVPQTPARCGRGRRQRHDRSRAGRKYQQSHATENHEQYGRESQLPSRVYFTWRGLCLWENVGCHLSTGLSVRHARHTRVGHDRDRRCMIRTHGKNQCSDGDNRQDGQDRQRATSAARPGRPFATANRINPNTTAPPPRMIIRIRISIMLKIIAITAHEGGLCPPTTSIHCVTLRAHATRLPRSFHSAPAAGWAASRGWPTASQRRSRRRPSCRAVAGTTRKSAAARPSTRTAITHHKLNRECCA